MLPASYNKHIQKPHVNLEGIFALKVMQFALKPTEYKTEENFILWFDFVF
jgi:hypothetical protein